jgi:hypothetical protein
MITTQERIEQILDYEAEQYRERIQLKMFKSAQEVKQRLRFYDLRLAELGEQ